MYMYTRGLQFGLGYLHYTLVYGYHTHTLATYTVHWCMVTTHGDAHTQSTHQVLELFSSGVFDGHTVWGRAFTNWTKTNDKTVIL